MVAGNPTGDRYVIHFPQGDAGAPCIYSGAARYLIEGGGELTFQVLADRGKLRRGYNYMICTLDPSLRCTEAPWWYFRDRTYAITKEGVAVNGSTAVPSPAASFIPKRSPTTSGNFQPRALSRAHVSESPTSTP